VADWDVLVAWAGTEMPRREEAAQRADGQVEELLARRRSILTGLRSRLAELDVTIPDDARPVDLVTAAVAAATNAESKVVKLREAMDEAKQLEAEIGELAEEAGVSELLGRLLRADRFSQWLVDEALELLVVNAGETLRELTNGQYSLATTEREFEVIDHGNADEHRPARTLSGGETFQASLALALALSEHVRNLAAEGAPRLDAIVLDEGFGTLDPETLEVVAGTIENLGSTGRMVGIITHVRELALRVPVRFEIRKGHRSSTVERVVA
jgi:exonuclease SbcC